MSSELEADDDATVTDGAGFETTVTERQLKDAERIAEALVFASAQPVSESFIAERMPRGIDVAALMWKLKGVYSERGVNLIQVGGNWAFRTAGDLSFVIRMDEKEPKKLSRAALEVLAIIAYHQPVTRAEIEEIRGVQTSRGTLDVLMEAGWVRFRGRRRTPGRPVTMGTTVDFLDHFGLEELRDLPGLDELKGAGLLSGRIPSNFGIPLPSMSDELTEDEDPITQLDLEELGLLAPSGEEPES
ncbi:chromosome segregation and condensation protein ScpA [Agrobacterium rubi TR3 = NBRC 13261]|uniref:Chromosome segregation and condensation protein ScpA n=1 Tax=Agrobacterium rubi TR3 = NBRC 13261 TaxID=1368415 RepID=A0A081CWK0_9HYPH|nr:SMC-Scp complex subunit ScpB [Agrobacterium rubi]MBP1878008.1 segregation and condensation protein B [Agrobacterium rubi]MCL6651810.1 SMC-Scp complex subunit ScpB [Agrobacterium rubi]GAK71046.1 chromosome segregation and condensation protein ScpA [Agrobacterium rubi TR3 = NBRC 13261]